MSDLPKPEEMLKTDRRPSATGWMDTPVEWGFPTRAPGAVLMKTGNCPRTGRRSSMKA